MKKIGIWGLGIVGKSAIPYFYQKGFSIQVMDKRALSILEQEFLNKYHIPFFDESHLNKFLENNDAILASCGIDVRPYQKKYPDKWLSELDLFYQECKRPIIAITGSVGKTTVTHLINNILIGLNKKVCMAGNVGKGLLDLIDHANEADYVVIEVSSFQLERSCQFIPFFAICTNLYENHLDRHGTFEQYKAIKYRLFQDAAAQHRLIPFALYEDFKDYDYPICFFSDQLPVLSQLDQINSQHKVYYLHNNKLFMYYQTKIIELCNINDNDTNTYQENIIVVLALIHLLQLSIESTLESLKAQTIPDHRLKKIATWNGIDFYDDSKSTIPQSTQAAIIKLRQRPIILMLGGISKGIDKKGFIESLSKNVRFIACFGSEAHMLGNLCQLYQIPFMVTGSLDDAFKNVLTVAQANDQVLFSPAGASYDLFADYQQRGRYFQNLVEKFIATQT